MPCGQALIAYLHLMSTDTGDLAGAAGAAANLRSSAEHPRERMHAAAVDAWLGADWVAAAALLDQVLVQWPTDLLALAIGHQLDFFLGDAANLRDRVGRSLPEFDPDHPHVGFVRGMHAFGLEEAGHYGAAEEEGLAALAANRDDVWGVHAVVHTYEMQGRIDDGAVHARPRSRTWGTGNLFTVHNWLHLGLYCLEAGDVARALAIYDGQVHHAGSAEVVPIEMLDASALPVAPAARRVPTPAIASLRLPTRGRAGRSRAVVLVQRPACRHGHRRRRSLDRGAGDRRAPSWPRREYDRHQRLDGEEIGLPAVEAVIAFGDGRYTDVIASLMPIRRRLHQFGGSHAHCDALHARCWRPR